MAISPVQVDENLLTRVEAASIDGRGRNVRYRQDQLHLLHRFLRENADAICSAIKRDEECTEEEAGLEFYLSMTAVAETYKQLNFEESLAEEYAATRGKNNVNRRVPIGIVLIRPGTYTRFYSVIAPLVTALGAGNCVLLEMPSTIRNVDSIVRQGMRILDQDFCNVSNQKIANDTFLSKCLIVEQTQALKVPSANMIGSDPRALVIAIVDRTANVEEAAAYITTSRCAFRGRSPHAPDIVIVNEFVKQKFIRACLQRLTERAAALASDASTRSSRESTESPYSADSYDVLFMSDRIKFLGLHKNQKIASQKIDSPILVVASSTGLVDSLTTASSIGQFAACYCFADVKGGKFLSQHIDSRAVFVNQIPAHWLVGPAFPAGTSKLNPDLRYDMDMFSVPRPEQVILDGQPLKVASKYLFDKLKDKDLLKQMAVAHLQPTGQASGSGMGFFDQGIITGVVAFVLPSIGLLGFSMYQIVRFGLRHYSS